MAPIDGLSDVTRLPRLGKIHLGEKVKKKGTDVEYPKATPYFVLPDQDEVGELATTMRKIYGDKPNELPVIFPIEDEDKFASQYYRCYSMTRGLVCKGDGLTCRQTVDTSTKKLANRDSNPENIELQELPCKGRECSNYKSNQCREIMMLQFMLPDIPSIGIWQIDTSSVNSIININSAVKLYKGIFGRVSMLPLTLTLKPQDVVSPVDQKKKKVYTLHLEARASLRNMLELLEKTPVQRLALTTPDESKPEIIEGEYEVKNGTDTEQAERDSEELFPLGGSKGLSAKAEKIGAAAPIPMETPKEPKGKVPKTQEQLFNYVAKHAKHRDTKFTKSFIINKFKIPEKRIDEDILRVYYEVKELMAWPEYDGE